MSLRRALSAPRLIVPGGVRDGLVRWHRADRGLTVVSGGVSQWDDVVGGRHMAQATASNRPQAVTVAGRQRVRFTASNVLANCQWMQSANSPAMTGASPRTLILVYEPLAVGSSGNDPGTFGNVYSAGPSTAPGKAFVVRSTAYTGPPITGNPGPWNDPFVYIRTLANLNYPASRTLAPCLVEASYDGSALHVRKNNGARESLTLAPSSTGLDEQRPAWVRMEESASTCLGVLLARDGLSWRTLTDGTVWVGQETWPESTLEHELLEEDHAGGAAVLWSQAFGPFPGETWRGRRLRCVQHEVEASRSRTTVWWSP